MSAGTSGLMYPSFSSGCIYGILHFASLPFGVVYLIHRFLTYLLLLCYHTSARASGGLVWYVSILLEMYLADLLLQPVFYPQSDVSVSWSPGYLSIPTFAL
ncbi:hypothetical protein BDR03DRAFT_140007 [Suillus americanus]|nr:hypothetical protein BDR03DRAFT_140007 [Suillus americanus]